MKTRNLSFILMLFMLAGCARTQKSDYLQWLYANMPLADSLGYSRDFWEDFYTIVKTIVVYPERCLYLYNNMCGNHNI